MKKEKITTNPITAKKKYLLEMFDEYTDAFSFNLIPISKASVMKIIKEGIIWAQQNEKAYKVTPFFREKGIGSNDIKRWQQKHPEFAFGYKIMKEIIGDRREVGALEKKLDSGIVRTTMHRYDSEWLEIDKYNADLRNTEAAASAPIHVYMDGIELTKDKNKKRDSDV